MEMTWRIKTILAMAGVLALAACSTPTKPPVAPVASMPAQYLIGPGDELEIFVWGNRDLTVTVPVRPDGRISTPLVEDMQAVGKTPTQLARDMEAALGNYVKSPQVNVVVRGFVGTYGEQIRVVGKATQPKALAYRRGMTVLDVMIEVGGLAEGAAGNRAKIIRKGEGGQTIEIPIRLDDLMNDGSIVQNLEMQPGDVLIIPESRL
jgi:polysaccharide export outer membrane protein